MVRESSVQQSMINMSRCRKSYEDGEKRLLDSAWAQTERKDVRRWSRGDDAVVERI